MTGLGFVPAASFFIVGFVIMGCANLALSAIRSMKRTTLVSAKVFCSS